MATAVTDAVAAARAADAEAFGPAVVQLATLNPEQVGLVLGAVVRSLLEDLHADGLSGEDVQAVLERCVRSASAWLPAVEPDVIVVLLVGALGVHPAEDDPRPPVPPDVARHAPLLVADLLVAADRPLVPYLAAAFAEIARSETIEMP